jgi:hypothetical protein
VPEPEKRNPAEAATTARAISQANSNHPDNTETAPKLQASRLVSRFGLAFETAAVVAALAWGIAR